MAQYYLPEGLPLPGFSPDGVEAGFWEACKRHQLVIQLCADCGTFRHTPQFICHKCLSSNFEWKEVGDRGVVYSFMNVNHPAHPALTDRVPFNIISVELVDAPGIRMIGNLVDATYEEIHIGMDVRVCWEDHPEADITVPRWQRA